MAWEVYCQFVSGGGVCGILLYSCFFGIKSRRQHNRDLEAQKNPLSRHVRFEDRRGALALD